MAKSNKRPKEPTSVLAAAAAIAEAAWKHETVAPQPLSRWKAAGRTRALQEHLWWGLARGWS